MYKNKLQELCHRRLWDLPEYTTVKDGPDHMPRFTAGVNVNGQVFETPSHCRSSKVAQNTVARMAYDHFNAPPARLAHHQPSAGSDLVSGGVSPPVDVASVADPFPVALQAPEKRLVDEVIPCPVSPPPSSLPLPIAGFLVVNSNPYIEPGSREDTMHMYKNRLQEYAQKRNLDLPVYTCESEGPSNAPRFKSSVTYDGKSYKTLEFFATLKEAEQAAAKVACQALSLDAIQEDGGLYKNLLQELARKKHFSGPSYVTVCSGLSHNPEFVAFVEIGSYSFGGAKARTKKQAEKNVAKIAYYALTEKSCPIPESSSAPSGMGCGFADNLTQDTHTAATTKNIRDEIDTESLIHAKRAKSLPEKVNVNADSPSNNSSSVSSQTKRSSEPVIEKPVSSLPRKKTVVIPRKSSYAIPEGACVLAISDDEWVAYKIDESTAQIHS